MKQVRYWQQEVENAQKRLLEAMKTEIAIGSTVAYTQGDNSILVEVIAHGDCYWAPDLVVRNPKTKRRYRLDLARVDNNFT